MARTVPPVPYKIPIADQSGRLSTPWSQWFREMFERIGGLIALTNTELATQQSTDISTINASISSLNSSVSALQSLTTSHSASITTLQTSINDLNQGPYL